MIIFTMLLVTWGNYVEITIIQYFNSLSK